MPRGRGKRGTRSAHQRHASRVVARSSRDRSIGDVSPVRTVHVRRGGKARRRAHLLRPGERAATGRALPQPAQPPWTTRDGICPSDHPHPRLCAQTLPACLLIHGCLGAANIGTDVSLQLDHMIVPSRDRRAAAELLARILNVKWSETGIGPFCPVYVSDELTLDFDQAEGEFPVLHYCFRTSDAEFEALLARLQALGIKYRSSPHGAFDMKVNTEHGGRIVYWTEPDGHIWEALTVSYARQPGEKAAKGHWPTLEWIACPDEAARIDAMHLDARGLPISVASAKAAAAFDHLATGFLTYRADTPARLSALLETDPDFALVHCLQGYFAMLAFKQAVVPVAVHAARTAQSLAENATDRERSHIAALTAWADGARDP